jgi:hypothetical protein
MADLAVIGFIEERLNEATTATNITFETRQGTAFYDLFVQPQEFMLQPFTTAMDNILIAQSVANILALSDPDSFDQGAVDDLASNVFVDRFIGDLAEGVVQVFYEAPVDREWPALSVQFTGQGGLAYFNSSDFSITSAQMALQTSGNYFYLEVEVQAQTTGTQYNAQPNQITGIVNDPDAVLVANPVAVLGGVNTESNTQLLNRIPNAIAVRDLETNKGISSIIQQNFPYITEIQTIGMGDPEMQRDIFYNIHTGGYTDIYVQNPPPLPTTSQNFLNLQFDTTRNLPKGFNKQISAVSFSDPNAALGITNIVLNSVQVTTNVVPTSASIVSAPIPLGGFNLTSHEYLQVKIDGFAPINVKVSGAVVSATQLFEIIDALNAALEPLLGMDIVTQYGNEQFEITSPSTGAASFIYLYPPTGPRTDATLILFPNAPAAGYVFSPPMPAIYQGVAPYVYVEDVDYEVDYTNGLIIKLPGSAIPTGSVVAGPATNGAIVAGNPRFTCPIVGIFASVQIGDILNITAGSGIPSGPYVVSDVIDNNTLVILDFVPTASNNSISFNIVSDEVQAIRLQYNPLSIDIGNQVILSDGVTRGIRPGRNDFTITTMAFLAVQSIEEIDPNTGLGLGIFLNPLGGYGSGGYGQGSYGVGEGGDYQLIVNVPPARFSAFEDSLLAINAQYFGQSFQVTYYAQPNIAALNTFCRTDGERVTGADVLPKSFVPVLVDMNILVKLPAATTLTTATLQAALAGYINGVTSAEGELDAAGIVEFLESQGVSNVQLPFTMTGYVQNTDGSQSIISSENALVVPQVTLPSQTANYVTPRISHFYARNITIQLYQVLAP